MVQVIFKLIFWASAIFLLHSYLFYPLIIRYLSRKKPENGVIYEFLEDMPYVSIIMAVHNEEKSISEKIKSVFEANYPINKLTFFIGSDASSDNSDKIIEELTLIYPQIIFKRFEKRVGKAFVINKLTEMVTDEIIVFTDAQAIFREDSLTNLIKHFKNKETIVVGGCMRNSKPVIGKVTYQELSYYENEYKIKYAESKFGGCMIGAFGAFYAIRKTNCFPVPENFISDDFYISMKAIEKRGSAIFEPEAIVFENVTGNFQSEYKRKSRIATGNFQNLSVLYPILFSSRFKLAFCFFSHKVIRWFGPVLIIFGMLSLGIIFRQSLFYSILFVIMVLSLTAPIIDFFYGKIQIHVILLRFITHFYFMNIALLTGLFRYMKGVKTNVWEPTKRE